MELLLLVIFSNLVYLIGDKNIFILYIHITQDLMLYRVSTDLEEVMAILIWMLQREEDG